MVNESSVRPTEVLLNQKEKMPKPDKLTSVSVIHINPLHENTSDINSRRVSYDNRTDTSSVCETAEIPISLRCMKVIGVALTVAVLVTAMGTGIKISELVSMQNRC